MYICILNLDCQGYSDFLRSFNSFQISMKLKSDEAIEVAVDVIVM